MRLAKFTDLADVNPPRKKISREPSELTSFVPMECVDENTGTIAEVYNKPFEKVSKGYTYFENGDIIFAKITPCMENGKSAIVENLKDGFGFGSTEFIVIRPKKDIYRRWLYQFVRSKDFRLEAEAHFTGSAGQQRVPVPFIENKFVPIPEHEDEINGIIAEVEVKLTHVEAMRQAALKQKEAAKALQSAILREVFPWQAGESLPSGWRWEKVEKCVTLKSGNTLNEELEKEIGDYPYLKVSDMNLAGNEIEITRSRKYVNKDEVKPSQIIPENSVIFPKRGGAIATNKKRVIRKPVLVDLNTMAAICKEKILVDFFYLWFLLIDLGELDGAASNVPQINNGDIYPLDIPIPEDIEIQQELVQSLKKRIEKTQRLIEHSNNQLNAIEVLPAAILREAFNFQNIEN